MPASHTPRHLFYFCWAFALSLSAAPASLRAQAVAAGLVESKAPSSTDSTSGPAGVVPAMTGFNASLNTTSQHDSSSGWSSILTPNLAYRFNRYFSFDTSIPVYAYINIDANKGTKAKPVYKYVTKHGAFGDTALTGHLDLYPSLFDYTVTSTLGLPTGKPAYGLGAGQVTYNVTNHLEKSLGIFTPDIEIGVGDSSSLLTTRVRKSYTAVGTLANFQAGSSIDLPFHLAFEADAYEQLPIAPSLVYSTTGKGKKKVTTATDTGPAEDNGLINSLDIPVTRHVTLSGFYNRSIRLDDDVAGFSFTFLLRPPPLPAPVVQ